MHCLLDLASYNRFFPFAYTSNASVVDDDIEE